jgi:hypothetical protein
MKKRFPCGHVGKGQYCHLCKDRADARDRDRAEREARRHKFERETDVGLDMDRLPVSVALKASGIIKKLKSGIPYMQMHGHRLVQCRDIVSIPVGWSHRIVCREVAGDIVPFDVLSHEQYNGLIKRSTAVGLK